MAKIAYANKVSNSGATAAGLVAAADLNEVKTSVNALYDVVPYKSFVAKLSQSGTAAPTMVILQNTTGLTFVATRVAAGDYSITPSVAPAGAKVAVFGGTTEINLFYNDGFFLSVFTTLGATRTDGMLAGQPIEFNIYP